MQSGVAMRNCLKNVLQRSSGIRMMFGGVRTFSTGKVSNSFTTSEARHLKDALEEEIQREQALTSKKDPSDPSISANQAMEKRGFKCQSSPGDSIITFTKEHEGITVTLTCDVRQMYENDNYDEEEEESDSEKFLDPLYFRASLSKNSTNDKLSFDCVMMADNLEILTMELSAEDGSVIQSTAYTGPGFHELSEDIHTFAGTYLLSLGIDAKTCNLLRECIDAKEQHEYFNWLGRIRNFL